MSREKPKRASYINSEIEDYEKQQSQIQSSIRSQSIELIDIDSIHDLSFNGQVMHNRITYNKNIFLELVESINEISSKSGGIMETGLLNAIMLRNKNGRLEIIHGRNRLEAFKYLNKVQIPCIICDNISDELARYMRTSENINRDNLNAYDETLSILEYIYISCGFKTIDSVKSFINKVKNFSTGKITNLTEKETEIYNAVSSVLKKVGKYDISTLANKITILNLNPNLIESIKEGRLDFTRAKIINTKLKDEDKILQVISYLQVNDLSGSKLKDYIDNEFFSNRIIEVNKNNFNIFNTRDIKSIEKKINLIDDEVKKDLINKKLSEITTLYEQLRSELEN